MDKILVVDDEAMIRALIRKYAEFEGYTVEEGCDGMEAVRLVRKSPKGYDMIILDIMMPELDGFSAAKEIRKVSDTPILFLSVPERAPPDYKAMERNIPIWRNRHSPDSGKRIRRTTD